MALEPPKPKNRIEVDGEWLTPKQLLNRYKKLQAQIEKTEGKEKCVCCNEFKSPEKFYEARNRQYRMGKIPVCKDCVKDIINKKDSNGQLHEPDRASLILALSYINKPYYNDLYEQCLSEAANSFQNSSFATIYISKIVQVRYEGKTFADSDFLSRSKPVIADEGELDAQTRSVMATNRMDVIDAYGYDPFAREDPSDQPYLYSNLIAMMDNNDSETTDVMRLNAYVSIARSFLQIQKLDNALTDLFWDPKELVKSTKKISEITSAKGQLNSNIVKMAAENCISLKNSKTVSKGDGTWTKKIKNIRELNLRAGEVNGYDLNTCKGMQQALDLSHQSILRTLKLEENEALQMLAEARDKRIEAQKERDDYQEAFRLVLRENLDLKALLEQNNIFFENRDLINLSDLVARFKAKDDEK